MMTFPSQPRLQRNLLVLTLAVCCVALTSCTALTSSTATPSQSAEERATAPAMGTGDSIAPTPLGATEATPQSSTAIGESGPVQSGQRETGQDTENGLATSQDCLHVAFLIDKLGGIQIGGVSAKDMDTLNSGLKNLADGIPEELKSELATLQNEVGTHARSDLPLSVKEFDETIGYFQGWLDRHCNFE